MRGRCAGPGRVGPASGCGGEGQAEAAWTDLAGAGRGGAAGRPVVELATRDCVLCGDGLHGDVR